MIGGFGAVIFIAIFIYRPSFPTPDKILVLFTLIAMAFGQVRELLKRFVPFVVLLFVYDSFRGLVPYLNNNVDYVLLPAADRLMFFGQLPTVILQDLLWYGQVKWYDFLFYGAYTLHFVLPFILAVLVWKKRVSQYWRLITAYIVLSFAGFFTFLVFPASPPWLASEMGLIEPITRISSEVWRAFGIQDFPSLYNKISPNPVAAMPSLHSAYAMLFALAITALFKNNKYSQLAWIYPVLIWIGTIYQGEHYAIDAVAGVLYAWLSWIAAPRVLLFLQNIYKRVKGLFVYKQKHAKVKPH